MGKISVYCKKKQILRLPGSIKLQLDKGVIQVDEDIVAQFPKLFHIRPEGIDDKPDETPSDADDGAQDDPGDAGEGESEKDDSEGSDDDSDAKVDPPSDPLAEAMAEVADLKDNKQALEDYGRKFGIELNRRKSLKNMKIDLEKALSELMSDADKSE
jgi:hypothetical protein